MEKGLHNFDHRADLIDRGPPTAVSGGVAGFHKNLQNLLFVGAYFAVGAESI